MCVCVCVCVYTHTYRVYIHYMEIAYIKLGTMCVTWKPNVKTFQIMAKETFHLISQLLFL